MKTLEYAVTNLNGNVESETLFIVEGDIVSKNMDVVYVDKAGRRFLHHKNVKIKSPKETKLKNVNPINMVKTFVNNTDGIFKQINLN